MKNPIKAIKVSRGVNTSATHSLVMCLDKCLLFSSLCFIYSHTYSFWKDKQVKNVPQQLNFLKKKRSVVECCWSYSASHTRTMDECWLWKCVQGRNFNKTEKTESITLYSHHQWQYWAVVPQAACRGRPLKPLLLNPTPKKRHFLPSRFHSDQTWRTVSHTFFVPINISTFTEYSLYIKVFTAATVNTETDGEKL